MIKLPTAVENYVAAANAQDARRVADCFVADGTVRDEGRVRRGRDDIAAWASATVRYGATIVPAELAGGDGTYTMHASVRGDFAGSPVTLAFHFALRADGIDSLEIKP